MHDQDPPSSRKKEKAGWLIAVIVILVAFLIFVGRNFWHGEELQEDQSVGDNLATEHSGPSYNQKP
ncbi:MULTISPECIES: hypothetical protein [Sphingobium]|jgi:hypothetical protein|uniref:hypothetical protein n=1 Tax=Sphingobium TaxID=165695 RepID=UPI001BEAE6F1|nr:MULTISPECIES: hypothetical protein [Sphingobium]MBT2245077.1 hypothetical protein [Sphingobium sp. BHU LFT2]WBQ18918.1 hypothetical protein PAE53_23960 [Sphingobium yanoikuyae]